MKTLILHGRGSKNHNFTEVRILLLFGSILGVILAPFWDPPDLKKRGFRVEGVSFFEKTRGTEKHPKK